LPLIEGGIIGTTSGGALMDKTPHAAMQ